MYFLVQSCRNRPAEFARCPRCPPGACQRRLLPLPVSAMLVFKSFLVQVGDFISYGVCKFICLSSFMYNRFHKELRFFFSLLKRKKEAKKEKSSRFTCTTRSSITRRLHVAKIPRRGEQAAAAAVTLPFSQLKLGRRVSGDSPPAVTLPFLQLTLGRRVSGDSPQWEFLHGIRCSPRAGSSGTLPRFPPPAWFPPLS